jgi:hypothetical protein
MDAGKISGNPVSVSASTDCSRSRASYGGGVCVARGTFTMNGGRISGNKASVNSSYGYYADACGGGVYVYSNSIFYVVTGTVYGSDAEEGLKNSVYAPSISSAPGAALYKVGTAQYGTFSGETWNSVGDLTTTENTIKVVNGVLQ